jgi:hypothetical protein
MGTARALVAGSGSWLSSCQSPSLPSRTGDGTNPAWSWSVSKFLERSDMLKALSSLKLRGINRVSQTQETVAGAQTDSCRRPRFDNKEGEGLEGTGTEQDPGPRHLLFFTLPIHPHPASTSLPSLVVILSCGFGGSSLSQIGSSPGQSRVVLRRAGGVSPRARNRAINQSAGQPTRRAKSSNLATSFGMP